MCWQHSGMKFWPRLSMILAPLFLLHSASPGGVAGQLFPDTCPPGSRLTPQEAQQIVVLHNTMRAEVAVAPLRWSEEVAAYAQQWADHLASTRCGMEHRPRSGKWRQEYGENLFIGTVGYYGISDAVRAWAREQSSYRGGAAPASRFAGVGHYTQMVWRKTVRIGCATAVCNGMLIVVCNYDPRGNLLGQSPY